MSWWTWEQRELPLPEPRRLRAAAWAQGNAMGASEAVDPDAWSVVRCDHCGWPRQYWSYIVIHGHSLQIYSTA